MRKHVPQSIRTEGLLLLAESTVESLGEGSQSNFCYDDTLPKEISPQSNELDRIYLRGLRALHGAEVLELLDDEARPKDTPYTKAVDQLKLEDFEAFNLAQDERLEKLSGKQILEAWGVKFSDEDSGDKLFQLCKLPEGWKKNRTEHYMYSNLVDNNGRVRGSIFFKPEFYDRSARLSVSRRLQIRRVYDANASYIRYEVLDSDKNVFTSGDYEFLKATDSAEREDRLREVNEREKAQDKAYSECETWLNEHKPLWRKSTAYWD